MTILGLDWGKSKVGVAIGNDELKIASPFGILYYKEIAELNDQVMKIVTDEKVEMIVVGHPKSLAGNDSLSDEWHVFITFLNTLKVKVEIEDERLSTKMAQVWQHMSPSKKGQADDDLAAVAILQSFFDRKL
jgi:putative Holliday junction resolvase